MAMKIIWTGNIIVGLVNLPVTLAKATNDPSEGIRAKTLHEHVAEDGTVSHTPINQQTWCVVCDKEVKGETVKGYPVGDKYVIVSDEEFETIRPASSKGIKCEFTDVANIDSIYFRSAYYLAPGMMMAGPSFAMIRDSMRKLNQAAVGIWTSYGRDHQVAIRPMGDGMVLHTLHEAKDIRVIGEMPGIEWAQGCVIDPKQTALSDHLVTVLSGEFDTEMHEDSYRVGLQGIITAKAEGLSIDLTAPVETVAPVIDMFAMLEASIAAGKPAKKLKLVAAKAEIKAKKGKKVAA